MGLASMGKCLRTALSALAMAAGTPALAQQPGTNFFSYPPAGPLNGTEVMGPIRQGNTNTSATLGAILSSPANPAISATSAETTRAMAAEVAAQTTANAAATSSSVTTAIAAEASRATSVESTKQDVGASVKAFGSICDGTSHPLSTLGLSLAAVQAKYPTLAITALTQQIDWAAWQAAVNSLYVGGGTAFGARGVCIMGANSLDVIHNNVSIRGDGRQATILDFAGQTSGAGVRIGPNFDWSIRDMTVRNAYGANISVAAGDVTGDQASAAHWAVNNVETYFACLPADRAVEVDRHRSRRWRYF